MIFWEKLIGGIKLFHNFFGIDILKNLGDAIF